MKKNEQWEEKEKRGMDKKYVRTAFHLPIHRCQWTIKGSIETKDYKSSVSKPDLKYKVAHV